MLKVLQVNSVCGTGSTGKLAVQISDYLNERSVENYIAYGYGKSDRERTFKFGNMRDAHLHSFLSRKLCLQGYGSYFTTWSLIRYIKRIKPDIVHLHNIHGHYVNFRLLFRSLEQMRCEVVWTFHDCWPMTGKCAHFTEVGCDKWKSQCYECSQLRSYPDSQVDRSKENYQDKKKYFAGLERLHIVAVSKWLKETVENSFFQGKDIRCIYNGIDLNVFKPTKSMLREELNLGNKFVILGVSSAWNEKKGFSKFLELAGRLDKESVIILLGVSDEQKKMLPPNVVGISACADQVRLAQFYTIADVLLNLSMEETFGLVVAEALACGTPAVVLNSTACPEVVNEDTGITIEPGDAEQLDKALLHFQKAGKKSFSESCITRVREMFSNEKMQTQYYELYCGLEKQM